MNANKKLIKNIFLMFLVYFLPKSFSFFLVPIYTSYLSVEEYGISDLVINTATLIAPFVTLSMPSALFRFTIEDRSNIEPLSICIKFFLQGLVILFIGLSIIYYFEVLNFTIIVFIFFIVFFSVLSDILNSYAKANEQVKLLTFCGVGSATVGLISNIILIVIFSFGIHGFLFATIIGYCFSIFVLFFVNRNKILPCICIFSQLSDKTLQHEMLNFSIPLLLSSISWWLVSFSDRYIVTALCGVAVNGLYSIAYKIPIIVQSIDNVFGQAWRFTLYDSYKTENGRMYIANVQSVYTFILCLACSFLMITNNFLTSFLFSDEFDSAKEFVPFLLLSVFTLNTSSLIGTLLILYKKSRLSMFISIIACILNIILNYSFIKCLENAIGAAIASVCAFFVVLICNLFFGMKISFVPLKWKILLISFMILTVQAINCTYYFNTSINCFLLSTLLVVNYDSIKILINRFFALFHKYSVNN